MDDNNSNGWAPVSDASFGAAPAPLSPASLAPKSPAGTDEAGFVDGAVPAPAHFAGRGVSIMSAPPVTAIEYDMSIKRYGSFRSCWGGDSEVDDSRYAEEENCNAAIQEYEDGTYPTSRDLTPVTATALAVPNHHDPDVSNLNDSHYSEVFFAALQQAEQ
jgi:hypothetical protein